METKARTVPYGPQWRSSSLSTFLKTLQHRANAWAMAIDHARVGAEKLISSSFPRFQVVLSTDGCVQDKYLWIWLVKFTAVY